MDMGIEIVTVGVGDCSVSDNRSQVLKTYALGSCVAVIIYDPALKIGGLLHLALPDSSIDQVKARVQPAYFADTGIAMLLKDMADKGAQKRNMWIKLAGGANTLNSTMSFDIGRRNILAVKKILWKNSLGPIREDIGGKISRTVTVSIDTGLITITSQGREWEL